MADLGGLKSPTWEDVEKREYDEWTAERIVIDTSIKNETECMDELEYAMSHGLTSRCSGQ